MLLSTLRPQHVSSDEALEKFGLPALLHHGDELRRLLAVEIERERRGESGEEMLRTLCVQPFSLGVPEDSLLIWEAKQSSFDAGCGLDAQFLCGAGLSASKGFLAGSNAASAPAALAYLNGCELNGNFINWTPQSTIDHWRNYYGR
jgi:hypothetical protein